MANLFEGNFSATGRLAVCGGPWILGRQQWCLLCVGRLVKWFEAKLAPGGPVLEGPGVGFMLGILVGCGGGFESDLKGA